MSITVDETKKLAQLQGRGNVVATVIMNLLSKDYAETKDGFKEAIEDGSVAIDQMLEAYRNRPPRNLDPANLEYERQMMPGYSRLFDQAGVVGQIWPGHIAGIPNKPSPLASMLVLGSLGGLAGYAGGSALERLGVPFKARRTGTIIGSSLGMIPGVMMAAGNYHNGQPMLTGDALELPKKYAAEFCKHSSTLSVERLKDYVWSDPSLPPTLAAATTALVEGANRMSPRRKDLPFVTPSDMGRMAVGLGSGYLNGLIAGKVLGGLFGISDKSQQVLRNSGMAAGLIKSVVPMVYQG